MTSSEESPQDTTARRRMEGLLAVMRGRSGRPSLDVPPEEPAKASAARANEDELAAVAWRAMHTPWSTSDGEDASAVGGGAVALEQGAVVGRYVVLRQLGEGGMGVVHAAYDPELDRKVALKLVRPGRGDEEGRTRLLREAQALAKLSHRNVVAIHDVGTTGGQVWLAMELVRGQTLREWLGTPRSWREVLAVLSEAGRGLAAAHEAGLLHRDFKPDNVMVGTRAGVRVMDFGLACARPQAAALEADESTADGRPVVDSLALQVTEAGTLLGTPVYMAPEQLMGREATPAVDQYALCVTLWEGLYGERPFAGKTFDALVDAVIAGKLPEPTRGRGVPGWLRRVCERGLSTSPQRRFESMDALLDALAKGQSRARVRRGLAVVGALAVLGVGAEGYRRWELAQRVAACEASGDEVGAAWNDERRQALHDGLVATGVSYAETTADKVMPWLDQQAQAWSEARAETCLDANVRERWDPSLLERSLWCLDERRTELESLVDELTQADADVVGKAVAAATGLASVAPCRDERTLEVLGLPAADEDREDVRTVRAVVTKAGSLGRVGRYADGLTLAREALEQAEALEWRPLVAAAHLQLGSLLDDAGAFAEAEQALEEAYFAATEGVAPEVAAAAAADLVFVVGVELGRSAEGQRWGRHAEAALTSVSSGADLPRARHLSGLAAIRKTMGDYEEAKILYEQALEISEQTLGSEHPDLASTLNNLAVVHQAMGAYDEAIALFERALAVRIEALGPDHPRVAKTLNNLAVVRGAKGDYEGAKALHRRALAIYERSLGPEHPDVAQSLNDLGNLYVATSDFPDAVALYERALPIYEKAFGAEHPSVAPTLTNLGSVNVALGDYPRGVALLERALAIQEKGQGPDHPRLAPLLTNLATAYHHSGDDPRARALYERALAIQEKALGPDHLDLAGLLNNMAAVREDDEAAKLLYERALTLYEKGLGPDHPDVARVLVNLAGVALRQGRPIDALALAQRGKSMWEHGAAPGHGDAIVARFTVGRALWEAPADAGRDRTQAVQLAEQSRDAYREAGPSHARELAEVEAWLAEHPRPAD